MNTNTRIRVGDHVVIYPRGKKGTYTAEFHHDGQHRRQSLKTRNRKVAQQRAREIEVQLDKGDFRSAPRSLTLEQAIKRYIDAKRAESCSKKTIAKYESELKTFRDFAADQKITRLDRVTASLHDRYRQHRLTTLAEKTVYNHAIIHKGFFKWCVSRDLLRDSPLEKVTLRKPARKRGYCPTLEQVEAILAHMPEPMATAVAVLACTGMRLGELQHLRPQDVDLDHGWIHIRSREQWTTKTASSERRIPIHPRILPLLKRQMTGRRAYVFGPGAAGGEPDSNRRFNERRFTERLKAVAKRCGIPVGRNGGGFVTHSLRHFFETFTVNASIPQRVVDHWMGHTGDKSMASVYYRLSDEDSQTFMRRVPFE